MKNKSYLHLKKLLLGAICICSIGLVTACGGGGGGGGTTAADPSLPPRVTVTEPLLTSAPGSATKSNGSTTIDYSNTSDGYIMINYTGSSPKVQIQITNPNGEVYPYPLGLGAMRAFPLTGGDGKYTVNVLENVSGDKYAMNLSYGVNATISSEFRPYLFPNQYVDYNSDSAVVTLGRQLSDSSSTDIDYVTRVYDYATKNISYDTALAASAPVNYIPNPDATLASGKGICFDYASVMSSMLRSQGIPTKLVVGYSGTAYHAWISVWLAEQGWVENIIQFDGQNWSLMDPTLAASNDPRAVGEYIGDGSNYTAKYFY